MLWNNNKVYTFGTTGQNTGSLAPGGEVLTSNNPGTSYQVSPNGSGFSWGGIGQGLQAVGGLFDAYTGYQNYQLQKDAFEFNKEMANNQYAMAKDAYDRQVARSQSIGAQMRGEKQL